MQGFALSKPSKGTVFNNGHDLKEEIPPVEKRPTRPLHCAPHRSDGRTFYTSPFSIVDLF